MSNIRVRFAPSPTGFMHLGSVRTALLNYLFARQKSGTFIIRLEDTDPERNFDPNGQQIFKDLEWLGLSYDEGPEKGGDFGPYQQSQRTSLYQEHLDKLIETNAVYRCFCTPEELDKKRQRQIALKQPPRYDRTCAQLSDSDIQSKLDNEIPFIWRFKINHDETITISDLARQTVSFDMKNFSDFPLTRANGTFTFIFANAVDDILMKITHVFRGEDHLSNTANQVALYQAFSIKAPTFWHMPIVCNTDGKKLSKRDFGFSLVDLQKAGYVPEAINNYLGIIGSTFTQEFMDLPTLVAEYNFDSINPSGAIKYDVEKLTWLNHKWIESFSPETLYTYAQPFLVQLYPQAKQLSTEFLTHFFQVIKSELATLQHVNNAARWYFERPEVDRDVYLQYASPDNFKKICDSIQQHLSELATIDTFLNGIKSDAREHGIKPKELFSVVRLALTGMIKGPQVHDIVQLLGTQETQARFEQLLTK